MNIDENVRKILMLLLRKWKLIVIFAIIGGMLGFVYTDKLVTPTYTSSVEFQASAVDKESDMNDNDNATSSEAVRISNTSKMNYAMKMIDTYIEIMKTNDFNETVASELNERLNTAYSADIIKGAMAFEKIEDTAMFKIRVTTTDPDLSFEIAHQLETTVPEVIDTSSDSVVKAAVKDKALKATVATSRGYLKKCLIATIAGAVIAVAYIVLRNLLDIRIKTADELIETYSIPVLASIPSFENKGTQSHSEISRYYKRYGTEKEVDKNGKK